jgi:Zn-dependent M16 (insulinase) family peptidase
MSDEEYQRVIDENAKLKQLQESEESPEIIATNPSLSISDIDTISTEYPISVEEDAFKSGVRLISHSVSSSGILYVIFGLDISMLPYEDLVMLPALVSLLNEAGTSELSDAQFRCESLDEQLPLAFRKPTLTNK